MVTQPLKVSPVRAKSGIVLLAVTLVLFVCTLGQFVGMLGRAHERNAKADREQQEDRRAGIKSWAVAQTTDELSAKLSAKPDTNSIALIGRNFKSDPFVVLGQVDDLREITTFGIAVTDDNLSRVANLKELRRIQNWGDTSITDSGLKHLQKLTKLEKLALGSEKVTDDGLVELKPLVSLRSLVLFNVNGSGLKHLTRLPLEEIALADLSVTDEGIAVLPQFKSLTKVELYKTSVTNKGFEILAQCKGLKEIKLNESAQISDDGLAALSTLSQLELLDLTDTPVTNAGAAKIKAAIPGVKVLTGSWRTQARGPSPLADLGWSLGLMLCTAAGALATGFVRGVPITTRKAV